MRIFRVDNPHTKPFAFWEWVIDEIKRDHPDVIFLAEAFTRPKVMHRLAKLGFTQSYTYFTWRNTKQELTEYFTELDPGSGARLFPAQRLAEHARHPARSTAVGIAAGVCRAAGARRDACRPITASTVRPYELMESAPREPGSEEYRDSEKYQLRHWDLERAGQPLRRLIARMNRIRRENPALQSDARPALLPHRQRSADRLPEARRRLGQRRSDRRQPRSLQSAIRMGGAGL